VNIVFFTGAGISKASGIPTFRGPGGLFEEDSAAQEYLTLSYFNQNPKKSWEFLKQVFNSLEGKTYNKAHELITTFKDSIVITQNIDSFHEQAGSKNVLHIHGEFGHGTCITCGKTFKIKQKCECGGWIKPNITFYGEDLDKVVWRRAKAAAMHADLFIVIGTSGLVFPAAELPLVASQSGAKIIEINTSASPITKAIVNHFIKKDAVNGLEKLIKQIGCML